MADLARDCGVEWQTAHQWRRRNSVPPVYWPRLCDAAKQRRIRGVTMEKLAIIAAQREAA